MGSYKFLRTGPKLGYSGEFSLPKETSTFTVEATAIKKALKYIQTTGHKNICIFSDAKTVLMSLLNLKPNSSLTVGEILYLDLYLSNLGYHTKYVWIKGHSQIAFRDKVDTLAKKACGQHILDEYFIPYTDFLPHLKDEMYRNWQTLYTSSYINKLTNYYFLFPKIGGQRWYNRIHVKKKMLAQILRISVNH